MSKARNDDHPATYTIRLQGLLDSSWSDWFGGLSIRQQDGETLLEGQVPDQAALHGVLAKIGELGLSIISVTKGE